MIPAMSDSNPIIVWLRDDLRLADQPALHAAAASGAPVLCVYVFDEASPGLRPLGGASRWWLHHSLEAVAASLARIGGRLDILRGESAKLIPALAETSAARAVFWTRRYGAAEIAIDSAVKATIAAQGREAKSFNGQLLCEPFALKTKTGGPYRVFTPFWRAVSTQETIPAPLPAPDRLQAAVWPQAAPERVTLADLGLLPTRPDWAGGLRAAWRPGEASARARLDAFLDEKLASYAADRDRPGVDAASRLSPHLRFGEMSPRTIWAATRHAAESGRADAASAAKFLSELGWRDFSYHLLFHNPDLATRNYNPRFDAFPWAARSDAHLEDWRRGRTGYPIVDAGMRELWATGTMHNRVRMIAASFLIKHLMIDWRRGEEWFWDTLCDADPASNPASWQWVAGSGADAAPYFRIFNPVTQSERFDPQGRFIRQYVPELSRVPNRFIHAPWRMSSREQDEYGIVIGRDFPAPIVDHEMARRRTLKRYMAVRKADDAALRTPQPDAEAHPPGTACQDTD